MKKTSKLSITILVCSLTTVVFAGPDFDEGGNDAGPLPESARRIAASTNTEVIKVSGTTSLSLLATPDLVDMYSFKTGSNPNDLRIDMNMGMGDEPVWDARLTIFKKTIVNCCSVTECPLVTVQPIATVVKYSNANPWPILDGSAFLNNQTGGPAATLGSLLLPNTEYFVAVSGSTNLPTGVSNPCSTTGAIKVLFLNTTGIGIYRATSEDVNYYLFNWQDEPSSATGNYAMKVESFYPFPASSCSAYQEVTGSIAERNFDFTFAPAITTPVPFPCAPTFSADRQFFYLWTSSCSGPAEVTTCGLTNTDTGIEVFELDACNPSACTAAESTAIACNDQCGTGNSSKVNFTSVSGRQYLVRLTRLTNLGTATTGTIKFYCTPTVASRDINGDGIVDGADLALLLGSWGTSGN